MEKRAEITKVYKHSKSKIEYMERGFGDLEPN